MADANEKHCLMSKFIKQLASVQLKMNGKSAKVISSNRSSAANHNIYMGVALTLKHKKQLLHWCNEKALFVEMIKSGAILACKLGHDGTFHRKFS